MAGSMLRGRLSALNSPQPLVARCRFPYSLLTSMMCLLQVPVTSLSVQTTLREHGVIQFFQHCEHT